MADLIAIGYDDETTAALAEAEVQRLAQDLVIQPDAVATIVRTADGKYKVSTNHHAVGGGATWGMFWGLLFGLLFFVPVFGMAVGAGLGALMGKVEKAGISRTFQDQVRDMMQPGTSALFLVVEKATPDKAVEALSQYGGTVLKSSLTKKAEADLQAQLHGAAASSAPAPTCPRIFSSSGPGSGRVSTDEEQTSDPQMSDPPTGDPQMSDPPTGDSQTTEEL